MITRTNAILASILLAIVAALTVVPSVVAPALFTPQAAAVSQKCKDNSFSRSHTRRPHIPDGTNGTDDNPTYLVKSWWTACPKADGLKIWKIGARYKFPAGMNPCNHDFNALNARVTFYPGGANRSLWVNCDSDGAARASKRVDIYVAEKSPPPQPHLARTVDVVSVLEAVWGGGLPNYEHKQVAMYSY